jgi:hypothetical protein
MDKMIGEFAVSALRQLSPIELFRTLRGDEARHDNLPCLLPR